MFCIYIINLLSSVHIALMSIIFKIIRDEVGSLSNTFICVYTITHQTSLGVNGGRDAEIKLLLLARCESGFSPNVNYLSCYILYATHSQVYCVHCSHWSYTYTNTEQMCSIC